MEKIQKKANIGHSNRYQNNVLNIHTSDFRHETTAWKQAKDFKVLTFVKTNDSANNQNFRTAKTVKILENWKCFEQYYSFVTVNDLFAIKILDKKTWVWLNKSWEIRKFNKFEACSLRISLRVIYFKYEKFVWVWNFPQKMFIFP